jgi:predicted RNA-binding Zn-ribbon protein involved in translation (DUF1610 family)
MCPSCNKSMIQIVYGQLNPILLEMANQSRIIIGDSYAIDRPEFYCPNCTEAF